MRVQYVRPPFIAELLDPARKLVNLAPFAQPRRAAGHAAGAVKHQPVRFLALRPVCAVAQPGDARHLQPQPLLGLQDRARAKGITAVQWQRMVEYVENAGHDGALPAMTSLTGRQPQAVRPQSCSPARLGSARDRLFRHWPDAWPARTGGAAAADARRRWRRRRGSGRPRGPAWPGARCRCRTAAAAATQCLSSSSSPFSPRCWCSGCASPSSGC